MNQYKTLFHVRGIPVSADIWFLVGMFIMYDLAGKGRVGIFTAVALAIFTVIHEVGHASVAIHFGAEAEIRLNFLIGWAIYRPGETLTRRQRNLISFAGPATEFVAAIIVLAIVRVVLGHASPYYFDTARARLSWDVQNAVIWAGVVLAFMNLMPLFPLDGGHIAEDLIHGRWGNEGRTRFLWWTLGASIVMLILGFGETSYASGIVSAGARLRFEGVTGAMPLLVLKSALSSFPVIATSTWIAFFCGFSSGQALYSNGSLRFGRGARPGWPGSASRAGRRVSEPTRPRPAPPKRTRKPKGDATVTPINREREAPHIDRATQADMDRLLDKISETGVSSLTPDERQRLDEHSRRLRGQ